jgi:ferredoxin
MAYKITNDCISCGACEAECRNEAISEGETSYIINTDKCTECVGYHSAPHCVDVCPVGAPVPDPEHEESKAQLLEKWYGLHPGVTPSYTP